MTDDELKRLQAICDAATAGPWVVGDRFEIRYGSDDTQCELCETESPLRIDSTNYDEPVHVHNARPVMLNHRSGDWWKITSASAYRDVVGETDRDQCGVLDANDSQFIAVAREAMPALIEEVRQLRQTISLAKTLLRDGLSEYETCDKLSAAYDALGLLENTP